MILGHTIKDYKRENLLHDVITGIIIMAVSIPISMGYSQEDFSLDKEVADKYVEEYY